MEEYQSPFTRECQFNYFMSARILDIILCFFVVILTLGIILKYKNKLPRLGFDYAKKLDSAQSSNDTHNQTKPTDSPSPAVKPIILQYNAKKEDSAKQLANKLSKLQSKKEKLDTSYCYWVNKMNQYYKDNNDPYRHSKIKVQHLEEEIKVLDTELVATSCKIDKCQFSNKKKSF